MYQSNQVWFHLADVSWGMRLRGSFDELSPLLSWPVCATIIKPACRDFRCLLLLLGLTIC